MGPSAAAVAKYLALINLVLALFTWFLPSRWTEDGCCAEPGRGSVAEAALAHFMRTGYGSYPVTRGEAVVGLLFLKHVLRLSMEEGESTSVQGAMRPLTGALVIDPDVPLPAAIARMAQAGTARLLVMHGDQLVGLLTMNGVIRRLKVREELAS